MSDSRKRKKQYYTDASKRARRNEDLRPGVKGFIITCNQKERNAVAEGYRLLNEYADTKYGIEKLTQADDDVEGEELSVEDALKKEVQVIKDAAKIVRRFQSLQNKANNVIFIKTTIDDPTEFATSIYEDLLKSNTRKTRFCLRFLPVISTCYAKLEEISKHAKPIIEEFFHNSEKPFTFHIMWKTRCNNTLKRDDVFPKLIEFIHSIEKGHTTDYKNPDVVLNLDVIGNVCCFGLLRNYYKFKKYNLDQLVEGCNEEKNDDNKSKGENEENSEIQEETAPSELGANGTGEITEETDVNSPNDTGEITKETATNSSNETHENLVSNSKEKEDEN